jgi:GTP-binding protein HflX
MTEISLDTGRRIGLLISRKGTVEKVIVGDAHRIFLPELGARRAGAARFRGVRLVLSNLRPEGLSEDDLTDLTLLRLDMVATIQVLPSGLPGPVHYASLLPPTTDDQAMWRVEEVESVHKWTEDFSVFISDLEAQFARSLRLERREDGERVILVGVTLGKPEAAQLSIIELERLAQTAGFHVVDTLLQRRQKLDGRTCIGKGKLQDLLVRSMHLNVDALVFDRELSPSQLRNIATETELKVLDRTQLILDIFSQRAKSREGKLQVELAQLRYRMPRLAIMPTAMSRLTGGIGGRGPGETRLEMNRRRAQELLTRNERQLKQLSKSRALRRKKRQRNAVPVAAIVGYTNAGKSTLLNRITRSDVIAEDKLFATLDPSSRRFRFPHEKEIILTDTVGFIQDLPKTLVQAFKATLEELHEAYLLLHVLDASDPQVEKQRQAVDVILQELGLEGKPQVLIWNKTDDTSPETIQRLLNRFGGLALSAKTGEGCEKLLSEVETALFPLQARNDSSRRSW